MATHSSTLAWQIPRTEKPGRLQPMGSLGVGHDWATSLSLFTFMHWRRKWQPTPVFLPGESQGRGAWWASIYGVAQSQTWLKRLSSSSSSSKHCNLISWKDGVPVCQDLDNLWRGGFFEMQIETILGPREKGQENPHFNGLCNGSLTWITILKGIEHVTICFIYFLIISVTSFLVS